MLHLVPPLPLIPARFRRDPDWQEYISLIYIALHLIPSFMTITRPMTECVTPRMQTASTPSVALDHVPYHPQGMPIQSREVPLLDQATFKMKVDHGAYTQLCVGGGAE